ncbi:receptor expression-enhancing protein 4 isoform X2 [Dromaius novaehollandiae]|uniref:receptor expression-enhancing protein 4 isoform X2 n=1 Tax=Dromaius novaehollandiae TaxID=8790 RepID=UPI00311F4514
MWSPPPLAEVTRAGTWPRFPPVPCAEKRAGFLPRCGFPLLPGRTAPLGAGQALPRICRQRHACSSRLAGAPGAPGAAPRGPGLVFGMLYPAYASYKAVKTKNIREYVRWMMYWIVFAIFMATETFTDIFISWFPFYYEIKMAFVIWLLSPYTRGASLLYRKIVHPTLSRKEQEIDTYIVQAKERTYATMVRFGKKGLNIAATAAVQAAAKSQGALAGRLRSFSMQDLRSIPDEAPVHYRDPLYLEEPEGQGQPLGYRVAAAARQCESDTDEEECWSDSPVLPKAVSHGRDPKPLSRSQSLRTVKKKPQSKEGSSRLLRARIRRKAAQQDQDS